MPRLSCVDSSIIISLTDSFELSFYLKKFCAEKTDGIRAGDILTVVSEERLKHAAIAMDSETIFEKPSVSGREGKGILNGSRLIRKTAIIGRSAAKTRDGLVAMVNLPKAPAL